MRNRSDRTSSASATRASTPAMAQVTTTWTPTTTPTVRRLVSGTEDGAFREPYGEPDGRCSVAGPGDAVTAVLAVRDLTVRFGGVTALDGVSFAVPAGQVCGLIGPNGAGKTTLFDCVSRLTRPQAGSIELVAAGTCSRSSRTRSPRSASPAPSSTWGWSPRSASGTT